MIVKVIQYWDSRDVSKLPVGAFFVDPYDGAEYRALPNDTLKVFMQRVVDARKSKGFPEMMEHEMRALVISGLALSVDGRVLEQYFELKGVNPSISDVVQFVKTAVTQMSGRKSVSYLERQERVRSCEGCVLHDRGRF